MVNLEDATVEGPRGPRENGPVASVDRRYVSDTFCI